MAQAESSLRECLLLVCIFFTKSGDAITFDVCTESSQSFPCICKANFSNQVCILGESAKKVPRKDNFPTFFPENLRKIDIDDLQSEHLCTFAPVFLVDYVLKQFSTRSSNEGILSTLA